MLHTDLPIYKTGCDLLTLAFQAQANMRRDMKRTLGEKINERCIEILDQMALANASKGASRSVAIEQVLREQRTLTVLLRVAHDSRCVSHGVWGQSIQLLDSIGKQAGGWLKSSRSKAPAV